MLAIFTTLALTFALSASSVHGFMPLNPAVAHLSKFSTPSKSSDSEATLVRRTTDPTFPSDVPSCVQCAPVYPSINTCAQAAPVFDNASSIIFNPGAFIDVIKCACTDTFKSAFPICVDCFQKTNQSDVLNTDDLPGVIDGLRQVCAVASVILSNVSESQSAAASGAVKTNTADTAAQTTGTGGGSAPGSGAASLAQSQTAMLFGLGLSVVLALPAALL